jgi:hypothetical protein
LVYFAPRHLFVNYIDLALRGLREQAGHSLAPILKILAAGQLMNLSLKALEVWGFLFEHRVGRAERSEMSMQNTCSIASSRPYHLTQFFEFPFDFARLAGNRMKKKA